MNIMACDLVLVSFWTRSELELVATQFAIDAANQHSYTVRSDVTQLPGLKKFLLLKYF